MSIIPIITIPDPVLRKVCLPVETIDDQIRQLSQDMLETMYKAPGIGLAASQVGVLRRLFVMDPAIGTDVAKQPMVLINPEILWFSAELNCYEEGCLSIPGLTADVERPQAIKIRYLDIDGKVHEEDFTGIKATISQHEIDHLNGKLFIDHLSKLKRDILLKKFIKTQRSKAPQSEKSD